jgi:hypothetical protein
MIVLCVSLNLAIPHPPSLPSSLPPASDSHRRFAMAWQVGETSGRIVRRSFENLYDWIGRTLIRKTRNHRKPFPLPSTFAFGFGAIASKHSEDGGERIKGEGGRKHSLPKSNRSADSHARTL